jgi:exodeoxyribonuclease VII large subunit
MDTDAGPQGPHEPQILSVEDLNRLVRQALEDVFPDVWVRGEISNFNRYASGHMYFSLKDQSAVVRCVMFRQYNRYLRSEPSDGQQVLVRGRVSVYERSGQYQIIVYGLQALGRGLLAARFEELKEKLSRQGVFDPALKKPIPPFASVVGVVTSPDGAAIRDIQEVASKRFPGVHLLLSPSAVQGDGAARQIVTAMARLVNDGRAEVIIVGRGGGSAEDLWPFNEEIVALAIFRCPIPVVSAVGHEIDFTIADFVADARAPTPSAAAEMVVPDVDAITRGIARLSERLHRTARSRLALLTERIGRLSQAYGLRKAEDLLAARQQRVDETLYQLHAGFPSRLERSADRVGALAQRLVALSPEDTLRRGYSITRLLPGGDVVKDAARLNRGDQVEVILSRGAAVCSVQELKGGED